MAILTPPSASRSVGAGTSKTVQGEKNTAPKTVSTGGTGSSGSSGSSAAKKLSDKSQVEILNNLLNYGFAEARDQRIDNLNQRYEQSDETILQGYEDRSGALLRLREDDEKSEADSSFSNLGNRARESADVLAQAANQGAGETDALRTQFMAVRNWSANQHEINRSYFDAIQSNNSAITELNADTRQARVNLANQNLADQEQAWATYQNQMADTASQLGNVLRNPSSDSYDAAGGEEAWQKMEEATMDVWESPGVDEDILNWEGDVQPEKGRTNSTDAFSWGEGPIPGFAQQKKKRPEGATLKNW